MIAALGALCVLMSLTACSSAGPATSSPAKLMAVDVDTGAGRVLYRLPSWARALAMPPSRRTGSGSSSGSGASTATPAPPSSRSPRNATLATTHPDGHGLRLLQLNTGADSGTWSPDGKQIAFRCRSGTGLTLSFRLCTSKLNGTGFRRVPWPVGSAEPDWGTHA
jgi:hypothetical protein